MDSHLKKTIKNVLLETFYSPLSKDEEINREISYEDKKMLYHLVMIGDKESLINKMKSITNKLVNGNLGEKNKPYIMDFIKRMVGRMLLQKHKSNKI